MDTLEQIFSKDAEILDVFSQFEAIKNIYDNSLIAMGEKPAYQSVSSSTSGFSFENAIVNTSKG
jgi:hypothetical protein